MSMTSFIHYVDLEVSSVIHDFQSSDVRGWNPSRQQLKICGHLIDKHFPKYIISTKILESEALRDPGNPPLNERCNLLAIVFNQTPVRAINLISLQLWHPPLAAPTMRWASYVILSSYEHRRAPNLSRVYQFQLVSVIQISRFVVGQWAPHSAFILKRT